jgi:hypothetical protein
VRRMSKIWLHFVGVLLIICLYNIKANAQPDTLFQYTFGGTSEDVAKKIIATSDTGYLIIGSTSSFGHGSADVYIIKIDSIGNRQWSYVYGTSFIESGYSLRETFDGFIIVGFTNQNMNYDALIMKIDLNGQFLWQKIIGGGDWDFGFDIETTPDSGFIICGTTYSYSNGGSDIYAIKLDSIGNILWQKNYGGAVDESSKTIVRDYDNNYVIIGMTNTYGQGDNDFYIIKIDNDGDTSWTKTIGGNKFDEGWSIDLATDSNYLIIGTTFSYPNDVSDTSGNILCIKAHKTGSILWQKTYGGDDNEEGRFINRLPDGNVMFGGITESFGQGGKDVIMYYVDSDGNFINGGTRGGTSDDEGFSATIGRNSEYLVSGSTKSFGCGMVDCYVIRKQIFPFIPGFQITLNNFCDTPLIYVKENPENHCMVNIHPNPAPGDFHIDIPCFEKEKNVMVKIFDAAGREIKSVKAVMSSLTLSHNEFEKGIYFISVQLDTHVISNKKLIVY